MMRFGERPLIVHVVHRFDVGGLENGVVNLINHLPAERYDHAVVAMTEVTSFRDRLVSDRLNIHEMQKPIGRNLETCSRGCSPVGLAPPLSARVAGQR